MAVNGTLAEGIMETGLVTADLLTTLVEVERRLGQDRRGVDREQPDRRKLTTDADRT